MSTRASSGPVSHMFPREGFPLVPTLPEWEQRRRIGHGTDPTEVHSRSPEGTDPMPAQANGLENASRAKTVQPPTGRPYGTRMNVMNRDRSPGRRVSRSAI